ncbi:hypothetical protein MMC22_003079 [Lobaria immixta]|nr:hypothetical protein [Lobaria immixta]
MRFTIVVSGLSALWLAFPAISLPTPLAARTNPKRFAIEARESEPAITRRQAQAPGDQVANGQWDGNYVADPSDGLGTNAQMSSTTKLLPPNWWLQATRLFNDGRGSGREYDNPAPFVIAEDQGSQYPADWQQGSDVIAILNDGRGSGRRKSMNLNTINSL